MNLIPFLENCNAIGNELGQNVSFFYDDVEGWFAKFDADGYSTMVPAIEPRSVEKERHVLFVSRLERHIEAAMRASKRTVRKRRVLLAA